MTDTWDGRPPEEWRAKEGWHWLSWQGGDPVPWHWEPHICPYGDGRAPGAWRYRDGASGVKPPETLVRHEWCYLCPCFLPDEVAALRARAERAEVEVVKAIGYLTRNCLAPRKVKPHDDLMGICTQVDHLLSTARAAALRAQAEETEDE